MLTIQRQALEALHGQVATWRKVALSARPNLAGFSDVLLQLNRFHAALDAIQVAVDTQLLPMKEPSPVVEPLTPVEFTDLQQLNRHLIGVTDLLHGLTEDTLLNLERHAASKDDPMFDFALDIDIHFELNRRDHAFVPQSLNYLTTRHESIGEDGLDDELFKPKHWSGVPVDFFDGDEKPCWLFHSLIHHDNGPGAPALPLRECLRIGRIHLNVQVHRQYCFDVSVGQWVNPWANQ
ncbi:MAG: hypothetical protein PSV24_11045 [Rhodoferax sp.]|nr:hypothetical protein [Rhodoferax sp.]